MMPQARHSEEKKTPHLPAVPTLVTQLLPPPAVPVSRKASRRRRDPVHEKSEIWAERLMPHSESDLQRIARKWERLTRADPDTLNAAMIHAATLKSTLPRLATWVRCKILRLPVADYARLVGISENTVRRFESAVPLADSRPAHEIFTKIAAAWNPRERPKCSAKQKEALEQAHQELLAHLPGVTPTSTFGVLRRWGYQVGRDVLLAAAGASYKAFWSRERNRAYYDFGELLAIGTRLGIVLENAGPRSLLSQPEVMALRRAWLKDCVRSGRPLGVSTVHALLAATGVSVTGAALTQHPGFELSLRDARRIGRFERVGWNTLEPVIQYLQMEGALVHHEVTQLKRQITADRQAAACSFEGRIEKLARERGFDNRALAEFFGLTESRRRKKPVRPIFRALKYAEFSRKTPPGVFAVLLGGSMEEIRSLLDQKRREIAERMARQRSGIYSPLHVERVLWGLKSNELRHPKKAIQQLEWHPATSNLHEPTVTREALEAGLEKARVVLGRWRQQSDFDTVSSAVASLLRRHPQHFLAKQMDCAPERLKSIARGEEVPPLPTLCRFLGSVGQDLSARLERNWFTSFAEQRAGENDGDLERLLSAFVATTAESRSHFHARRGIERQSTARFFISLSNAGTLSAIDLSRLVKRIGILNDTPIARLLRATCSAGSAQIGFHDIKRTLRAHGDGEILEDLRAVERLLRADLEFEYRKAEGELTLEELLADRGVLEQPSESPDMVESARRALYALPGLTRRELCSQPRKTIEPVARVYEMLLDRAAQRGITERDLAFCLQNSQPGIRQAGTITRESIRSRISSPLAPLGVIAGLVASEEEERSEFLQRSREAIKERLSGLGLPIKHLQVELQLWGIRPEDLPAAKKYKEGALWNTKRPGRLTKQFELEIDAIGLSKLVTAIDRLTYLKRAFLTPDVCRIFLERDVLGAKGLADHCALPLGGAVRFAEGTALPTFAMIREMAARTEFPIDVRHEVGWHLTAAEFIAARYQAPLTRVVTHLGLGHPELESLTSNLKLSTFARARIALLRVTNRDSLAARRLLERPQDDRDAAWQLVRGVLEDLGYSDLSRLYQFCFQAVTAETMRQALRNVSDETTRDYCRSVVESARDPGRTGPLSFNTLLGAKEQALDRPGRDEDQSEVLRMLRELCGATVIDLADLPAVTSTRTEVNFVNLLERKPIVAVSATERRVKTRGQFALAEARVVQAEERRRAEEEAAARQAEAERNRAAAAAEASTAFEAQVRDLVGKIVAASGREIEPPSASDVEEWCRVAGNPGLSKRYPSLYLAAKEGRSKDMTAEEGFVRALIRLNERLSRMSGDSGGAPGIRVFTVDI